MKLRLPDTVKARPAGRLAPRIGKTGNYVSLFLRERHDPPSINPENTTLPE
jgi:hypothetical protein